MTPSRADAVAFDVLGTLFSLEALRGRMVTAGLPAVSLETWFAESLRDAFALAASDAFQPLRAVLDANLDALLQRHGITPGRQSGKEAILDGLEELEPYPDAAGALAVLRGAGVPILAVSNGSAASTEALLRRAGLHEAMAVISVDEVGLSKPRREVYLRAARRAGVPPERLALIAAHPWDVHGAKSAGLLAGFVARGRSYPASMTAPDVQGEGLADVAAALVGGGLNGRTTRGVT